MSSQERHMVDQYVPIWTVANFNQVKKLSSDIKLITEVLIGMYVVIFVVSMYYHCRVLF